MQDSVSLYTLDRTQMQTIQADLLSTFVYYSRDGRSLQNCEAGDKQVAGQSPERVTGKNTGTDQTGTV